MVTTVGSKSSPGSALASYGGKDGARDFLPRPGFVFEDVEDASSSSTVGVERLRFLVLRFADA